VASNYKSFGDKGYLESQVCKELIDYDVKCYRAIDILSSTKQLSFIQIRALLKKLEIDALVSINLKKSFSHTVSSPDYKSTVVVSSPNLASFRNILTGATTGATQHYSENHKTNIVDYKNGQVIFEATSDTGGAEFATNENVSNSLANELVEKFSTVGFVQK